MPTRSHTALVRLFLFCLLVVGLAASAVAQVPTTINYQGRLLENTADQDAATGTVDIVFSLWTEPTGGTQLWSESWTGMPLSNGIFSVLLGSNGSPLDPADFQGDSSLYLELEVAGETLDPRQALGSAPFAIVDEPANEIQDLALSGNQLTLSQDPTPDAIDLAPYLDDTTVDNQVLSLSGNTLSLTSDDGTDQVDLSIYLDGTEQDLASVLAQGADADGASMTGVATVEGNASEAEDAANVSDMSLLHTDAPQWQSWTSESNGYLTQIDAHHDTQAFNNGTLQIYEGEGTGGTLLLQETAGDDSVGWVAYTLGTPVAVTAGQQYTVRLTPPGSNVFRWRYSSSDPYAGGRSGLAASWDFAFRTFVMTIAPSLDLSSGSIQVAASALEPADDAATDLGSSTNRWRDVYASNGVIQTSDGRLKADVETSPYGLEEVLALRPVAFRWKVGGDDRRLGFLAEQVEPLVPEAVAGGPSQGAAYGMSYTALVPVLTRAIQELQVLLDLQAERIEELEAALRDRR